MDSDGRPIISPTTPGPGLAILCLCSAGASALVAGTAVLYQARLQRRQSIKDLETNWNILLALGLVRTQLSSVRTTANAPIIQIVSVAQSAVTFKEVSYGLGYPITKESPHDLLKFEQVRYACRRYRS